MKKKHIYLFIIIFICIVLGISVYWTYSSDYSGKFTREQLQDFVVSTALSYYYNKGYSDYEQTSMEYINSSK